MKYSLYDSVLLTECGLIEPNSSCTNWDKTFAVYDKAYTVDILESYEFVEDVSKNGKTDHVYKLLTNSGKEFTANITYYDNEKSVEWANTSKTSAAQKRDNALANDFNILKDNLINSNGNLCIINFYDSTNRNTKTEDVAYESFEVFSSLSKAVKDSLLQRGMIKDIFCICVRVSKQESERKSLYKRMFSRHLKEFSNFFEDTKTSDQFDTLYFSKT